MRKHFSVLALSLLVLIISLAGLMAVLDILPQPEDSDGCPEGEGQLPGPDGVESSVCISSVISLRGGPPPHIPIFEVAGAATTSYLRSISATYYEDGIWTSDDDARYYNYEGETLQISVASYDKKTEDDIAVVSLLTVPSDTTPLPASLYPVRVLADVSLFYFPEEQFFNSEEGLPEEYTFRTVHYAFDGSILSEAEVDSQDKYLQLPADITERTRELAWTITKDVTAPYEQAKAIEHYLKTNYTYDFYFKHAPEGREPNDWFLFEERRGVCANFNSAFVVLSRCMGIPSRLVGGFQIKAQEEKQVVYSDQAHAWSEVKFKDLGWYNFDATGSYIPDANGSHIRLPTVTEITFVESAVKRGHSYRVQGFVHDLSGKPADGQWVEVFVNAEKETEGGLSIGEGSTDSQGQFDIEVTIPAEMDVGDYNILAHCLESARYQESWSDPVVKVVATTNLNMELPSRVTVQEPVMVKGTLAEEFGKPLAGRQIDVYLAGKKVTELATDDNGQFIWEQGFDKAGAYALRVAFAGTDYYLESSREAEFQVLIPTAIRLDVTSVVPDTEATVRQPIRISGSLSEKGTRTTLPGQEIEILIDSEPLKDVATTDEKGSFQIEYTFDGMGQYQIEARFSSVPFYWESSASTELEVFPAPDISPWPYLTIVLTLVLSGVGGFFFYRWQKRRRLLSVHEGALFPVTEAVSLPQRETRGNAVILTIDFPRISSPFPDVWGVGEPLEIVCHLENPQGRAIAETPLGVHIGGELIAQLTTDKSGTGKLNYTFIQKGQYEVIVRTKDAPSIGDVLARRTLRIVDYREEMVNLFQALVNWFRGVGIGLDIKLTPREMQYQVLNAGTDAPERLIDTAVSCFEEADYSLHSITRRNYQDMYLAQREITEHGGKFTEAPRDQ